jgi:hypothetical protein
LIAQVVGNPTTIVVGNPTTIVVGNPVYYIKYIYIYM